METARSKSHVLHILRSVMLAGAGAVVWMALSSTAASADSGSTDGHSLLSGVNSSATSIVHTATAGISAAASSANAVDAPAVVSAPAAAPAHVIQPPAVQTPSAGVNQLPQAIDQLVASVPVLNTVVPEDTVAAVTAPALEAAGPAVDTVGSLPGAITGIPVTVPAVELPAAEIPAVEIPAGLANELPSGTFAGALASGAEGPVGQPSAAPLVASAGKFGPPGLAKTHWSTAAPVSGYRERSAPMPSDGTFPSGVPASGAATGSAALPGNPPGGAAAWLPDTNLFQPLAGILISTATSYRLPAPVSFDPGSSPD